MSRTVPPLLAVLLLTLPACQLTWEAPPLPPSFHAMESAVDEGERSSAYLGAEVALNESEDLMSLELQPGVRVVGVAEDGPAAQAGLRVGDVLLEFDGRRVDDPRRLVVLLEERAEAGAVMLQVQRGDAVLELDAEVEVRVARSGRLLFHIDRGLLRAAFRDGTGGYPEVVELAAGSPLLDEDVIPGTRVLAFQGRDPGSTPEFLRRVRLALQPGDPFELEVEEPDGRRRQLELEAWAPEERLTRFRLWPLFGWSRELDGRSSRFWVLDLILVYGFKHDSASGESSTSFFGLLGWESGEPMLEEVE